MHPHVVAFRQAGQVDKQGLLYLVMDQVEGDNLGEVLSRGAPDPAWVRVFFGQLASALEHVHMQGITHRDLKPENIMVRPDGSACIIDFGIALEEGHERVTREGMLPGTISYMPPEVFRHGVQLDARKADIYAFGVMLYEALTATQAFPVPHGLGATQQTAHVVARKLERGPLRLGPEVPRDLGEVVSIATHPDPTLRFASMRLVAERLGVASAGRRSSRPRASQAPGTVWFDDEEESAEIPRPASPTASATLSGPVPTTNSSTPAAYASGSGSWNDSPETRFDAPRPTREDVLEAMRTPAPAPAPAPAPPPAPTLPPAPPITRSGPVVPPPPPPVPASLSSQGGDAELLRRPSPAEESISLAGSFFGDEATGDGVSNTVDGDEEEEEEDGVGSEDMVRVVAAVGCGGLVALTAVLGIGYMLLAGDPPETPAESRLTQIHIDGEPGDIRVDGVEAKSDAGMIERNFEFGAHAITVASEAGCIDAAGRCDPCCGCKTDTVEIIEGDGAQEFWVAVPEPPSNERKVALQIDGLEDNKLPVSVSVGEQHLNVGRDGLFTTKPVGKGSYPVRVDVGGCTEEEGGCLLTNSCPSGCLSWTGEAVVECGEGDVHVPITIETPEAVEPTPTPTPEATTTRATPRPTPRPKRTPKPTSGTTEVNPGGAAVPIEVPKALPYVFVSASVTKGGLDVSVLQTAMRGLRYRMKSCYSQLLQSDPKAAGRVVLDFKVAKDGSVSKSGFSQRSGSGNPRLDVCASGAVRTSRISGAKPGAAQVVVTFEVK